MLWIESESLPEMVFRGREAAGLGLKDSVVKMRLERRLFGAELKDSHHGTVESERGGNGVVKRAQPERAFTALENPIKIGLERSRRE